MSLGQFKLTFAWPIVVLVAVATAQESALKPAPDAASLAAARQQVRQAYADDFRNAQVPKSRSDLAARLIAEAHKGMLKPEEHYAMLAEAMDLLRDAGDLAGAMKVVDTAGKSFAVDAAGIKVSLVKATPRASLMGMPKSAVQTLAPLVDECIAADKYAAAKEIADLALAAAKAAGEKDLVQQQTDVQQDVDLIQRNFTAMTPVLATLKTNPADPAANLKYGRFLCLMKGDWDAGLPHLAASPDTAMKALANRELVQTAQATALLEKGDAMWKFADTQNGLAKRRARQRAGYWYQQALPELSAADKARIQPRLGETAGPKGGFSPAGAWTKDTGTVFTLNADGTIESSAGENSFYKRGRWAMEGQKVVLTFGKTAITMEVVSPDELKEIVTTKRADGQWLLRRKPGG